jgi:serine protease Do
MQRIAKLALGLLVVSPAFVRADDESLKQALALESTIHQIVEKAEPSVVCILVSRSKEYAKFDNGLRSSGRPGELGGFNAQIEQNGNGRFRRNQNTIAEQELIKRLDLSAPEAVPDSYGTGVVVDGSEAKILTNYHVIRDATKIYVRLPSEQGRYANIDAADERSDLAILRLIKPPIGLHALPRGDADNLKKGKFVISISNPFAAGFHDGSPSVSWGMLSNVRRRLPGEPNEGDKRRPRLHYYPTLLQTDMRFPAGCSGGALLDLHGNWIGLTTSIPGVVGGDSPGGYAIPLDTRMKRIVDKLLQGQEVEYGFLGISQDARDFRWVPTLGGPADRAGMRYGDEIVEVDGQRIHGQDDLLFSISTALAGTRVKIIVTNGGEKRELTPVLAKSDWPSTEPVIAANRPGPVFGMRVDYSSVMVVPQSQTKRIPDGVVVREVVEGSPAEKANLRPEQDYIIAVNGQSVDNPTDFYAAVRAAGASVTLTVKEESKIRTVKLP